MYKKKLKQFNKILNSHTDYDVDSDTIYFNSGRPDAKRKRLVNEFEEFEIAVEKFFKEIFGTLDGPIFKKQLRKEYLKGYNAGYAMAKKKFTSQKK